MTPTRPEYRQRTPSTITIAPPSRDPRYKRQSQQSKLSPRDALRSRQQSYGFSHQARPSLSIAPQPDPQIGQTHLDWSQSTPDLQSRYMMDPTYQKSPSETIAMLQRGQLTEHRPMSPPPRPFIQPLPPSPPPLPLIAYAGKRPDSPDDNIVGPPVSRFVSAPASLPLRETAKQRLRQVFSRDVPPVDWRNLPLRALACVLTHLRALHLEQRSRSCDTCYMRDLVALQMSCKAWSAVAQNQLYSKIAIVGNDASIKLKKFQTKHGGRLIPLRRTLRKKPSIALLVVTLHVPDPIIPLYQADGNPNPEYDEYISLLASVIMCCPNLEALTGFHPFYNHTFDRLTHALSTRSKLKQHVWIMSENDEVSERSQKQLAPGLLDHHQVYQFRQYHKYWKNLETLMLCSPASLGVLEHEVFVDVLHNLPVLKNLCVSSFDPDDFNDMTLFELPKLVCLRLEECEGVSDYGLSRWAASPSSILIERLTLIHQNINSLATISKLFSGLVNLRRFTLMQSDVAPSLPLDMVVFPPLFASRSVQNIHWDIGEDIFANTSNLNLETNIKELDNYEHITANTHLALSILHHGFPALKTLRAPRDTSPQGVLQSVCRPAKNANMLLPSDIYSTNKTYASRNSNSLQIARIRAQNIIDESIAANKEFVKVLVTDHSPPSEHRDPSRLSSSNTPTTSTDATEIDLPSAKDVIRLARERRDEMLYRIATSVQQPRHYSLSPSSSSSSSVKPLKLAATPKPLNISSFSLPTFIGRISISISSSGHIFVPPTFSLVPEHEGRDANGGLATWGGLLKIKERVQAMEMKNEEDWIQDGCIGAWNKGRGDFWIARKMGEKGSVEGWRHEERERWRRGKSVLVEDFF